MKKGLIASILCIMLSMARGQNPILQECVNINKAYLNSPYLSFNVKYKYSYEATPTVIEDSSAGVFKINGYRYWGKVDSVEFMQNDSFLVTLFQEDKIMSLGLKAHNFNQHLLLSQWDSLFFEDDRFTFTTGVDGSSKKITVDYDPDLPCKKLELWYDSVTYRIQRIKYVISEYAADENFYQLGDPGVYGIVDMLFSNYQTGMFGDSIFATSTYILLSELGEYVVSGSYEDYQLYISSPGLLK